LKSIETSIIRWFSIAISAVRIAGKSWIFNYSGVREDILEILLNLKGIVLKQNRKYAVWSFKIQGPAVITADLIQLPSFRKKPNHYITTISTSNILEIEFKFEHGTGYRLASQAFLETDNYLQLDTIFMLCSKVDFKIENVYDNSKQHSIPWHLDKW
jgi:DNA-directed RNA polymerase subunit alpha